VRLRSSSLSCSSELSERKTKAVDTCFLSLRYREITWRDEVSSGGLRRRTRLNSPRLAHSPPKPTATPKTTGGGNLDLFIDLGSKKCAKFFQTFGTLVLFLRSYSFHLCCFGNQFSMIRLCGEIGMSTCIRPTDRFSLPIVIVVYYSAPALTREITNQAITKAWFVHACAAVRHGKDAFVTEAQYTLR